ncbi:MAG: hypothetical protein SVW02_02975 [Candidatus Nanohaloarchaea archaeon]|nr:hypothetical protein [Candidatus Nanohaloarchaea archaeon]
MDLSEYWVATPSLDVLDGSQRDDVRYIALDDPALKARYQDDIRYLAAAEARSCLLATGYVPSWNEGFATHVGARSKPGAGDASDDAGHPHLDWFQEQLSDVSGAHVRVIVGDYIGDAELFDSVLQSLSNEIEAIASVGLWHTGEGRPACLGGEETGGHETSVALDLADGTHYRYRTAEDDVENPVI